MFDEYLIAKVVGVGLVALAGIFYYNRIAALAARCDRAGADIDHRVHPRRRARAIGGEHGGAQQWQRAGAHHAGDEQPPRRQRRRECGLYR